MKKEMRGGSSEGQENDDRGMRDKGRGGKDKGMAPAFRDQSEIRDGVNINIEKDAQGRSVKIFAADGNLRSKGEGNYVGPFREVVGKENLLPDKGSRFVNENRETTDDDEPGVD